MDLVHVVFYPGEKLWVFPCKDVVSTSPALGPDNSVYFASDDGHVYCLDSTTGTVSHGPCNP